MLIILFPKNHCKVVFFSDGSRVKQMFRTVNCQPDLN